MHVSRSYTHVFNRADHAISAAAWHIDTLCSQSIGERCRFLAQLLHGQGSREEIW
jgi:hypothetical protein